MIRRPDIPPQIAPKEPQAPIVPPWTVADRMTHEMVEAINPVAILFGIADRVANFGRQLGRDPLICVENKNPLVRRLRDRPILEIAASAVFALDDPAAKLARERERTVRRSRIGHE